MWFKTVRLGQVYRAIDDVKTLGMVILKVAGSGGFYCTIPKGTKVVINNEPWPISRGVSAAPLNYKELENVLVPLRERESPMYKMYALIITLKDLKRYFVKEDVKEIKFDDERIQIYFNERMRKRRKL